MQTNYLTPKGIAKLEEERKRLKEVDYPEVLRKLKEAKDFGDLAENAEYDDARTQQGIIIGRLEEIDAILKNAKPLDNSKGVKAGVVSVGSVVTVNNEGDEFDYTLVSSVESDPKVGLISTESPTGKALLGAKVGQVVAVTLPDGGKVEYKVVKIA